MGQSALSGSLERMSTAQTSILQGLRSSLIWWICCPKKVRCRQLPTAFLKSRSLDLLVLKLEKQWGLEPGGFYALERQTQIDLMALWRHEATPQKDRRTKLKADKAALIKQKIKEYSERDQPKLSR